MIHGLVLSRAINGLLAWLCLHFPSIQKLQTEQGGDLEHVQADSTGVAPHAARIEGIVVLIKTMCCMTCLRGCPSQV
jgi:hypothetical protein